MQHETDHLDGRLYRNRGSSCRAPRRPARRRAPR
ncbi:hypothetical protein [Streptomyces lincolnensis]